MDEQLISLYHRHIAMAFDRKLRLAQFVHDKAGKVKWQYDAASATLFCGPKLKFDAPLLGTHTHANDSWLWAWGNRNLKLTLTNRALGDLVRVTAHRISVPMLAHPAFSIEPLLGPDLTPFAADIIAGILCLELGYESYHVITEDDSDSAILIRHERHKQHERHPLHRVLTIFPRVIEAFPILDHRTVLTDYARDYSLSVTTEHGVVRISDGRGEVTAKFDDRDRLIKIEGSNVAAPPVRKAAPNKPEPPQQVTPPQQKPAAKAATKKPTTQPKQTAKAKIRIKKKSMVKKKKTVKVKAKQRRGKA